MDSLTLLFTRAVFFSLNQPQMGQVNIMWVDDEIDILEGHKIFLEMKGYKVLTFANGYDAVEHLTHESTDLVLLDESMPGMSGLETLSRIKEIHPHLPIVLITKNETESLMEEAIGSQIADYLIKPVNPSQVLLSLKKILDNKRLIGEKTTSDYHQQFRSMFDSLGGEPDHRTWSKIYRQLIFWEMEMEKSESNELVEVHMAQKREANAAFFKYISRHYASWMCGVDIDPPLLSHTLFKNKVLPYVSKKEPLVWVVVDNLRFDQWKAIEPLLNDLFRIQEEDCCYSILPTATQYCRNAMFAGETPLEIERKFPDKWKKDDDEEGKNLHESFFFTEQLKKLGRTDLTFRYQKISSHLDAVKLADTAHNLLDHDLSIVVYNFVDMMSHARTEMDVLKELAADEAAYRSLTRTWLTHSPLYQALKKIAQKKCSVVLCTDHGSIQVKNPVKVTADKQTTNNLRYKNGKNLDYDPREVLAYRDPHVVALPKTSITSSFIFAKEQDYLCYPNSFNHFAAMYKNTFQHGGVSMEEVMVPVVRMSSRVNEK
jgi:CheY-like chemotaxis protein